MNNESQSPKSSSKSTTKVELNLRHQVSVMAGQAPPGLRLTNLPSAISGVGFAGNNLTGSIGGDSPTVGGGTGAKLGNWGEVQRVGAVLDETIQDLDKKLNRVLAKQEYEYLKGYNIYVKQKEKDLRDLIEKLNEKNSNNTMKDEKISKLESTIGAIREDQIR